MSVCAALITVGDELLLGQTVDTNAAWLARQLASSGIPVVRRHTVGDVAEEIQAAVESAMEVADLVVVSGGLGPTPDDLTRDAVAGLLGLPLVLDQARLEALRRRFASRGYEDLPEVSRSQAEIPQGATVLDNPHGTAPGLAMEGRGTLVVLLPGVPRELEGIYRGGLQALLAERFGDRLPPVCLRVIHTTGIPESLLAERVAQVLPRDSGAVTLAFLPDLRGVDLRLTARGLDAPEAAQALDRIEAILEPAVRPYRFHAEEGDLAEAVLDALRARGARMATAESCTGGYIGKRITDRPGSSDAYLGGVVAYANTAKEGLLGVDAQLIEAEGAVSEAVARQMAEGAALVLGADAAVAVTGVAGPGGGTVDKPVGTVWHAATFGGRTVSELQTFPGDRASVRERAAQAALFLLLRLLDGRL
jgi:nicotinamide-nucleotide amidase